MIKTTKPKATPDEVPTFNVECKECQLLHQKLWLANRATQRKEEYILKVLEVLDKVRTERDDLKWRMEGLEK